MLYHITCNCLSTPESIQINTYTSHDVRIIIPCQCIFHRTKTVIVVPWAYLGICTLSVAICIPKGEARGNTYNSTRRVQTHTPTEAHGTADLYHDPISQCFPDSWGSLATAEALFVLATIHPRVYGNMKGCTWVYGEQILWQYLSSTHASWYKCREYILHEKDVSVCFSHCKDYCNYNYIELFMANAPQCIYTAWVPESYQLVFAFHSMYCI